MTNTGFQLKTQVQNGGASRTLIAEVKPPATTWPPEEAGTASRFRE